MVKNSGHARRHAAGKPALKGAQKITSQNQLPVFEHSDNRTRRPHKYTCGLWRSRPLPLHTPSTLAYLVGSANAFESFSWSCIWTCWQQRSAVWPAGRLRSLLQKVGVACMGQQLSRDFAVARRSLVQCNIKKVKMRVCKPVS